MKKNLIFSALALVFITASAHAAEVDNHRRLKLYEFNFRCEFNDHDHDFDRDDCRANAQVFAWVDPDDWMTTLQTTRNVQNRLRVKCGNVLVYDDGAFLDPDQRSVSITAIGGDPRINVERREHQTLSPPDEDRDFEATLRVRGDRLRGRCEVRNHPVDEHLLDASFLTP
ncbi:MAG: hypothetical protein ACXWPM_00790 [Bdellovibrionota bacterium]